MKEQLAQCPKCHSFRVSSVFGSETNGEPLGECFDCDYVGVVDTFKTFPQPASVPMKFHVLKGVSNGK